MSHQIIVEKGMVSISLAANEYCVAKRFATCFCRAGLNPVVLHQAKVGGLQPLVVRQLEPLQILDAGLG